MKKTFINALILSVGIIANMDIQAAPGVYIDANGGYGAVGSLFNDDGGFAYSGNVGYQFNNYFGLELGYNHFADQTSTSFLTRTQQLGNYSTDLALKGTLPVTDRWNLFGKLGLAYVHNEEKTWGISSNLSPTALSVTGPAPYLAAGVNYQFSQRFDINAQIHGTTANNNLPSMSAALLGLSYHFN